jgi:hypothetical protein
VDACCLHDAVPLRAGRAPGGDDRDSSGRCDHGEARVTGGAQLLTDLVESGAIAAMPAGTESPPGGCSLEIPGFIVPLRVLWPAARPPPAVPVLRDELGL